jgi:uncharacterized membrane protein YoaK (UPF0700 family)
MIDNLQCQTLSGIVFKRVGAFGLGQRLRHPRGGHIMDDGAHMVTRDDPRGTDVPVPSVDDSLGTKLLPFVLSMTAGSADVIGFLGLGGLFIAHITGNLAILAARLVAGEQAPVAHLISVPVFMVALGLTKLLATGLERIGIASLRPLLSLQLLLLFACFAICLAAGLPVGLDAATTFAGMLGVSAMAVQNALVRLSLAGVPSTAVMTTNVTVFTLDVGEMVLGRDADVVAKARDRARRMWPAIVGFLLGCVLGAACEAAFGLKSFILPAGFALVALALDASAKGHHAVSTGEINKRAP